MSNAAFAARIPQNVRQIVSVRQTEGHFGTLTLYEKCGNEWRNRLETQAYLGRDGVGKTRAGDMKTPLGIYSLTTPFGILPDPGKSDGTGRTVHLGQYLHLTDADYWCGQDGPNYNRLVHAGQTPGFTPDERDEHLIDYIPAYNHCLFITYNEKGIAGRGSAIFLHCMGKKPYTAGCVAVPEEVMRELLLTLEPNAKIIITAHDGSTHIPRE